MKVEALLDILYKKCFVDLKDQFEFPKKSIFDINRCFLKSPRNGTRPMINPKQFHYPSDNTFTDIQSKEEQSCHVDGNDDLILKNKKIQIKRILKNFIDK